MRGIAGRVIQKQNHPHPNLPPEGPRRGPRAVNEQRETKVSLRYLLSFKTTPIPTFPLKGKESYPRRG
ncbi:MAG: hypothetical protein JWM26_4497 [Betaproteobacteria bacterium]|nr:hypothetical protein [Betaproteobacteria bacterium]